MHNLASIYANKGKVDEAIALFKKSLEINNAVS
ncbi:MULTISPECIES: tetratricopeptide repeat protein [unclassified Nostoc]|nr:MULTISPECIES: tetratricopeptide repeat protein [unclassified Nostoc]